MDSQTISTLTGVVIGAITVSIPKIWEYFFEGRKHKYEVRKMYFEKKYEVLQAYVATCTQLSASSFNNAIMIRELIHFDFIGESDPTRSAGIENLGRAINANQQIINQLEAISSAATMFIDLKNDNEKGYRLIGSTHAETAKVNQYMIPVYRIIDKYHLLAEPESNSQIGREYFSSKQEYNNHLEKIANNLIALTSMMNQTLKVVRDDIKTFKV